MGKTKKQLEDEVAERNEVLEEIYNKVGDVLGYEEIDGEDADEDDHEDDDYDE